MVLGEIFGVVLEINKVLPAIEDAYQRIINLAHSIGGGGFENMAVEELKELSVESEWNEGDYIDLLSDANSNADAAKYDIENKTPSVTTSFNSKAIGEVVSI
jgi:hypothetical protein